MDMILVIDNIDDFATTNMMFFSAVGTTCKVTTAVMRRERIINLIKILQEEPCKACNEEELAIQTRYDRLIKLVTSDYRCDVRSYICTYILVLFSTLCRSCSVIYILLASLSATGATIGEVFAVLQGELPYRGWAPYTLPFLFLFTSLQEMLALLLGTLVNIATETLVFGFCLQTCAQLEILTYRLYKMILSSETEGGRESLSKNTFNKTNRLSRHIYHHLCIIRLVKRLIKRI